jgi:hypothetical protein
MRNFGVKFSFEQFLGSGCSRSRIQPFEYLMPLAIPTFFDRFNPDTIDTKIILETKLLIIYLVFICTCVILFGW